MIAIHVFGSLIYLSIPAFDAHYKNGCKANASANFCFWGKNGSAYVFPEVG